MKTIYTIIIIGLISFQAAFLLILFGDLFSFISYFHYRCYCRCRCHTVVVVGVIIIITVVVLFASFLLNVYHLPSCELLVCCTPFHNDRTRARTSTCSIYHTSCAVHAYLFWVTIINHHLYVRFITILFDKFFILRTHTHTLTEEQTFRGRLE